MDKMSSQQKPYGLHLQYCKSISNVIVFILISCSRGAYYLSTDSVYINLVRHNIRASHRRVIVIVQIQALFRRLFVSISMICLPAKFYMLWASSSLVTGHHIER